MKQEALCWDNFAAVENKLQARSTLESTWQAPPEDQGKD